MRKFSVYFNECYYSYFNIECKIVNSEGYIYYRGIMNKMGKGLHDKLMDYGVLKIYSSNKFFVIVITKH